MNLRSCLSFMLIVHLNGILKFLCVFKDHAVIDNIYFQDYLRKSNRSTIVINPLNSLQF